MDNLPRPGDELTADMCCQLADLSIETGEYQLGLDWLDLAERRAAPSLRLMHARAYALYELGRLEEAQRQIERCMSLDTTGESHFIAAVWRAKWGDLEGAESAILHALDLEPVTALELRDDADLVALTTRPKVRAAMRKADARLD